MKDMCKCGHKKQHHDRYHDGRSSWCRGFCDCMCYEEDHQTMENDLSHLSTVHLFHRLWTKAVGEEGYKKDLWLELESRLNQMDKDLAEYEEYFRPKEVLYPPNRVNIFGIYVPDGVLPQRELNKLHNNKEWIHYFNRDF